MSNNFEWQTEEGADWEDIPEAEELSSSSKSFALRIRRWLPWLGGAAVLLLIVGFVVVSLLNRQVEQVENTAAADVLAAHSLVRQAAQTRDIDLFMMMVSDDSSLWYELQNDLLNIDLFLERQQLYLRINYDRQQNGGEEPVVTLSPDLKTAEVVELFLYQGVGSQETFETIWLEQAFYYERAGSGQGDSWRLSPLPDDESFWGKWGTFEGSDYLTLVYPRRDEEVALGLGSRLDDLIGRICSHELINCPVAFHLELRLSREPSSLKRFNEDYRNLYLATNQSRYILSLPSPTLIGRPVDEAGTDALYQGYANWLAGIMVSQYFEGGTFFEGDQIVQIMAELERDLPPAPVIPVPITAALPSPPIPFPEQDILVACSDSVNLKLLRYNLQGNRWIDELNGIETIYLSSPDINFFGIPMTHLPDGSGLLMNASYQESGETQFSIVLWRGGEESLFYDGNRMYQLTPNFIQEQFDPTGQNMLVTETNFTPTENGEEFELFPYGLNIENCLADDCVPQAYNGLPYWSPDLAWALLVDLETQSILTLRDEQIGAEIPLGRGFSPYWTGQETFIYIRPDEAAVSGLGDAAVTEIVAANVTNPLSGTVLVTSAEIAAVISEDDPSLPISVHAVIAHPERPDWLFFSAALHSETAPQEGYLVAFEAETEEINFWTSLENSESLFAPFKVIQNGQMLFVQSFGPQLANGVLSFFALNPEETIVLPPAENYFVDNLYINDLSQDSRWLVMIESDGVRLIAPGQNYDHTIQLDLEFCYQAVWINK